MASTHGLLTNAATFRAVRRQPASALLVIAALALGAAATITLFAFVSAVFLEPLPYPDADRLVWLQENHAEIPARTISYPNFLDWRADNQTFAAMATFRRVRATFAAGISGDNRARAVDSLEVPASYFGVLGIAPQLGRDFTADEDVHGAPLVAIVSHSLWQSELNGDAAAIGASISIDGAKHTIVGIAPAAPEAPGRPEAWVLAGQRAAPGSGWTQRDNRFAGYVLARLKPDVTIEQAAEDLQRIEQRIAADYPFEAGHTAEVLPLRTALYGELRLPVMISFGAVAVLLLIVCVNSSNLLLLRATARRPEFALRAALGAGTRHIVRQVLAESAMFALLGTGAGVLLAIAATELLRSLLPEALLNGAAPTVGLPVALFALALMICLGLLTGLAPALRAAAASFGEAFGAGSRATPGGGRLRDALAVAQIALALALLVCAVLLAESMARIERSDYGFDPRGVLTFRVLADPQARRATQTQLQTRALASIAQVPGVQSVAIAQELPGRDPRWQTDIAPESAVPRTPGVLINVDWAVVSGAYFETLRMPLASGRAITEQEAADGAPVMLIDENLARRFWPNGDAVGKHIRYDSATPIEIVGVVADMRTFGRQENGRIKIYTPYGRFPLRDVAVIVRASGEPLALLPQIRAALQSAVPGIGVYDVSTLRAELAEYVAPRTLTAWLVGLFAALAAALAALGIYGVVSYATLQRSRELVIRMALGARPASIARLLLGKGVALTAAGIVLGLAMGGAASRAISSLLFGVSATSPAAYVLAAAAFAVVAVAASVAPAWRARKLDPAQAMRNP
jgi:putative ABC transport system permease protein